MLLEMSIGERTLTLHPIRSGLDMITFKRLSLSFSFNVFESNQKILLINIIMVNSVSFGIYPTEESRNVQVRITREINTPLSIEM